MLGASSEAGQFEGPASPADRQFDACGQHGAGRAVAHENPAQCLVTRDDAEWSRDRSARHTTCGRRSRRARRRRPLPTRHRERGLRSTLMVTDDERESTGEDRPAEWGHGGHPRLDDPYAGTRPPAHQVEGTADAPADQVASEPGGSAGSPMPSVRPMLTLERRSGPAPDPSTLRGEVARGSRSGEHEPVGPDRVGEFLDVVGGTGARGAAQTRAARTMAIARGWETPSTRLGVVPGGLDEGWT